MTNRPSSMHYFCIVIIAAAAGLLARPGYAEGNSHLRVHYSKSSETDLATVVVGDFDASRESNYLIGATWGRDVSDTLFGLPLPMTAHVGMQYFNERGLQADGIGATAFIKANYTLRVPFSDKHVRVGLGEGLSYVNRIPLSERRDFAKKGVDSAKLMNYLEWTIDVPLRQFAALEPLMRGRVEDLSVGFIVWPSLERVRPVRRRQGRREFHGLRHRSEILAAGIIEVACSRYSSWRSRLRRWRRP